MKPTFVFIIWIMCTISSDAQTNRQGWGRNSNYNRLYDPATEMEIKGEIHTVERVAPLDGMSAGIHLLVNEGNETISVHLGPEWYFDKLDVEFKPGEMVIIKGSKIMMNNREVIIARQIVRGDQVLKLRDRNGVPKWSGRRPR